MAENYNYSFSFFNDTTPQESPQEFIDSFSEFTPPSSLPSFAQEAIYNFQGLVDFGQEQSNSFLTGDESESSPSPNLPSFAQDTITNFQELVNSGQQSVATNLEEDGPVNAFGGVAFDFEPADQGTGSLGQVSIKFDGDSTPLFTLSGDGPTSLTSLPFDTNGSFFA